MEDGPRTLAGRAELMNVEDDSIDPIVHLVVGWPDVYLREVLGVSDPKVVQAWAAGTSMPSPAQQSVLKLLYALGPTAVLEALGLEVPVDGAVEATHAKKSQTPTKAALDLRARVDEAQSELERRIQENDGAAAQAQVLGEAGAYTLEFLPIEANNPEARVFILGLTPGRYQAEIYMDRYLDARRAGHSHTEAAWTAKTAASFAGAMRTNLVSMLDELGLPQHLGMRSTTDLFEQSRHMLQTSSAICYPAYKHGKNYGDSPTPNKIPLLWTCVEAFLPNELAAHPKAVVIPLGRAVEACLQQLLEAGSIDPSRVLLGFPHPSGANGHRARQFEERRVELADKLKRCFSLQTGA